jgi:hypothetical protein
LTGISLSPVPVSFLLLLSTPEESFTFHHHHCNSLQW